MFGRSMTAVLDRKENKGPIKIELGPPKNEAEAAKKLCEWMNDNRVAYYLSLAHSLTASNELDWLKGQITKPDDFIWLVYVNGELVGTIGLHRINWKNSNAELGISLGNKAVWRKGIATTIELMVAEYGFRNLSANGLHKVFARVYVGNVGSQKALQNAGFTESGIKKEHVWQDSRWFDEWHCEQLQSEWQKRREELISAAGLTEFQIRPGCEDI